MICGFDTSLPLQLYWHIQGERMSPGALDRSVRVKAGGIPRRVRPAPFRWRPRSRRAWQAAGAVASPRRGRRDRPGLQPRETPRSRARMLQDTTSSGGTSSAQRLERPAWRRLEPAGWRLRNTDSQTLEENPEESGGERGVLSGEPLSPLLNTLACRPHFAQLRCNYYKMFPGATNKYLHSRITNLP